MYYSSESSDSDNVQDKKSLDLSYLMLDSDTLASYLRNSVREQCSAWTDTTLGTLLINSSATKYSATQKLKFSSVKDVALDDKSDEIRLEHKMETLSTEAVGKIFHDKNGSEATALPFDVKSEQLRTLKATITKSRNVSESDDCDSEAVFSKDDITEKLYLNHNLILNVPFEIVLFHKLKFLDISNNNLTHLNDYILHLPELQTLYLKNNQLDNNGLPKDLSELTKIREINLSGNQLTVVPPQLYEVASLRYLYLGNNSITEVRPEIKALQNLQVLHLGGNSLTNVPEELGALGTLSGLVLSNNKLRRLPRAISRLTKLRSLLLHTNNLCCLPVEIVKLRGLNELSLRDNPLVTRFVNSCAKELMHNPPSLKELAARSVQQHRVPYTVTDLPTNLHRYLASGHKCVNPKCKGVYFSSCVEHIKFVDFCGMYRVPLMHYLCSTRCTSQTPSYYGQGTASDSDDDTPDTTMRRVLLG